MDCAHKSKQTFLFWCFAFWCHHLRFSNYHFGEKRGARGITMEDLPNEYMAQLSRPDWQGTKGIKNPSHHTSKSQVWKCWELHCFLLSCSDNKLTRSTFSVTLSGRILLPSKAQDLLMSPEQKIQCSITQALQENEEHYGGAPAHNSTCWHPASTWKVTKLPGFISIDLLPVISCWCKFLWYESRNIFQMHKEALKSLADWLSVLQSASSSSLQNLINTRPRDCMWSTKLLDFKHKVLKDFWKMNLYQIFTEGTFGKNSKCSIFYLHLF